MPRRALDTPAPVQAKPAGSAPSLDLTAALDSAFDFTQSPAPVQARGDVGPDAAEVQARAAEGVAGSGTTLPHLDQIQASFGPDHDLSGVRAHVGGDAATAAGAIGTTAYATGSDIAFASSPELHLAAHEAAHVVQQQAGVHLAGGVGQAGDAYEQHADAVADRVVAGQSAADLLAAFSPGGTTHAVQRAPSDGGILDFAVGPAAAAEIRSNVEAAAADADPGQVRVAADAVFDAAQGVLLALNVRQDLQASLVLLGRALSRLADVMHRHSGHHRRDKAAIRRGLDEALTVAHRLASVHGPHQRDEVTLMRQIGEVEDELQQGGEARGTGDRAELSHLLDDTLMQLEKAAASIDAARSVAPELDRDALRGVVATTHGWRSRIAKADRNQLDALTTAIRDQSESATMAVAEMSDVVSQPVSPTWSEALNAYIHAIALSTERRPKVNAALERARFLRRRLGLERVNLAIDDGNVRAGALLDTNKASGEAARRHQRSLTTRMQDVAGRLDRGDHVDRDDVTALELDAREQGLYTWMTTIDAQVRQTRTAVHDITKGLLKSPSVWLAQKYILGDIDAKLARLGEVAVAARARYRALTQHAADADPTTVLDHRRDAISTVTMELQEALTREKFMETFRAARDRLGDAAGLEMLSMVAETIALALTGNVIGAAAARSVQGARMAQAVEAADSVATTMRAAAVPEAAIAAERATALAGATATAARGGAVAGLVTESIVGSVAQKYLQGDKSSLATLLFVNLGTNLAVDKILSRVRKAQVAEAAAMSRGEKIVRGIKHAVRQSVELGQEMIISGAVDYALSKLAGRDVASIAEQDMAHLLLQGASIYVGKRLSHHVAAMQVRVDSPALRGLPEHQQLTVQLDGLSAQTRALAATGDADAAHDVLEAYARALDAEAHLLDRALTDSIDSDDVRGGERVVEAMRANRRDIQQLSHLGDAAMAPPATARGGAHDATHGGSARPHTGGDRPELAAVDAPAAEPPPRVTTAAMVPGSEFRGRSGVGDADAVKASAMVSFDGAMRAVTEVAALHRAQAAETFIVTTPDGDSFTVRVMTAPLPSEQVARTVINTSKRGKARAIDAIDTAPSIDIEGRYVIQLSEDLAPGLVERALVHEAREIVAERELARAERGGRHDRLRPGPQSPGHELSPHDLGRLAELEYLVRMAKDPAHAERAQREVLALIDHLGLRSGGAGADERWNVVRDHLREEARLAVERLRVSTEHLNPDAAHQLEGVRAVAADDAARAAADAEYRRPLHETPLAPHPEGAPPISRDDLRALAKTAAAARAARSKSTVAHYRGLAASLNPGEHPVVQSPMVGGGASLGARRVDQLLVDARGRWQEDPSDRIAQTANQLRGLADAGVGDPFQFARPDERVPMEAIHYWEDSIAAQGEVIDGTGTLRFTDDGIMLLEVMPHEGPPPVILRVEGTPVMASGFPKERAPGMAFNKSSTGAVLDLAGALATIAADPSHPQQAAAAAARDELRGARGANEASLAAQVLARHPELRETLRASGGPDLARAVTTIDAYSNWDALRGSDLADGKQHVFLGDEANLKSFDPKVTDDWVIAGTGGTGISAAEIILDNNPKAHVTMVGAGNPEGLMDNDQARRIVLKHGDAASVPEGSPPGDGRLTIKLGYRLGQPKTVKGAQGETRYEAGRDPASGEVFSGEGYIAALGREGELPPAVLEAARAAFERDPKSVSIRPLMDRDDSYVGYEISIKGPGRPERTIAVTGAASRTIPSWISGSERVNSARAKAADVDAPPESGNFDGGFVASATQSAKFGQYLRGLDSKGDARRESVQ